MGNEIWGSPLQAGEGMQTTVGLLSRQPAGNNLGYFLAKPLLVKSLFLDRLAE
jgi:hypothetical protein